MFKLLKSKKGFTLVELMIVVVIMAILVAVAVPIFTSVTSKSRAKTCLGNQREIQAQLSNAEMGGVIKLKKGDVFTLETDSEGESGRWTLSEGSAVTETELNDLFQKPPICPYAGNTIVVTISEPEIVGSEETGYKVTTICNKEGSKEVHGS